MDSNGPDVKIRGTAQHIFEKYQALARDAQSSGDRVGAENYLQHAEHYYRLILQAQAQNNDEMRQNNDARRTPDQDNTGDNESAGDEQSRAAREKADSRQPAANAETGKDGDSGSGEAAAAGEETQPKRRAPRRRRAPRQTPNENREETDRTASGEGGDQTPAEAAQ